MTIVYVGLGIFERKKIMELELKHLAAYLPYGLKVLHTDWNAQLNMTVTGSGNDGFSIEDVAEYAKPILRPLSDLLTIHKGAATFIDIIEYYCGGYQIGNDLSNFNADYLPYVVIRKLLEWHFDVFGLIEQGLAIDINTVD